MICKKVFGSRLSFCANEFMPKPKDYADRQAIIITHERNYLPSLIDTVYLVEQNDKGISKAKVI